MTKDQVQLSKCVDGTFCPRNNSDVNATCCEMGKGENAGVSGSTIPLSVVGSIQGGALDTTALLISNAKLSSSSTVESSMSSASTPFTSHSQYSSSTLSTLPSQASSPTQFALSSQASSSTISTSYLEASPSTFFTTESGPSNAAATNGGYTTNGKIGLGVGVGIGLPTLIITLFGFVITYLQFKKRQQLRRSRMMM